MPGDAAHRFHHFAHAESMPIADVVDQPRVRAERLKSEDVRVRKVADVHIVADTGAVRRRIILPKILILFRRPRATSRIKRESGAIPAHAPRRVLRRLPQH